MNAIFTFIIEHVFSWMKILFGFLVFDMIFRFIVTVGWLEELSIFIWYVLNLAMFKIFPEVAIVWVLNIFTLVISVEVLWLILGHRHKPNHHNEEKK